MPTGRATKSLAAAHDETDDLMAGNERQLGLRQLSVDDVQVGSADAAGRDCNEDLALGRLRIGQVGLAQRRARRVENHRTHG